MKMQVCGAWQIPRADSETDSTRLGRGRGSDRSHESRSGFRWRRVVTSEQVNWFGREAQSPALRGSLHQGILGIDSRCGREVQFLLSGFPRSSAQASLGFRTGPTCQNLVPKSGTLLTAGPAAGI